MKNVEARRTVPISVITLVLFCLMAVLQVFVITGGYELDASSVKKVAPWAYEPFLKITGEHPDTRPEWAVGANEDEKVAEVIKIGGIRPDAIPVTIEDQPAPAKKVIIEPTKPLEQPRTVIPVTTPEKEEKENPEEVVPVG